MNDETCVIEQFDSFLNDLILDPDVPAPLESSFLPEEVDFARRLVRAEQTQPQSAAQPSAAKARVWRQVLASTSKAKSAPRWADFLRSLFRPESGNLALRVGMTVASLVLAVAIGLYLSGSQTTPVSAQEIITKAEGVLASPANQEIKSFVLTEIESTVPGNLRLNAYARLQGDESLRTEIQRWYQAPNLWRTEYVQKVVTSDGKLVRSERSVHVSDGRALYQFDESNHLFTIDPLDPRMDARGEGGLFGQSAETLRQLFSQVGKCYDPKLAGDATVAGRSAYTVDLGATKCASASGPEMQGRIVIWVDQETSFVLKTEWHDKFTDKVIVTDEVTNVQYNVAVDPAEFVLTPPAGSQVQDHRNP